MFFRQYTGASMNALMDPSSRLSFPAQLGCQGFIIIDAEGRFITTKSAVYLDLGDAAFLDVEQILINAGQSQSSTQFLDATVFQPRSIARESSPSESRATVSLEVDSLPTVGYEDMDAEHERITSELENLLRTQDLKALAKVRTEFGEHSKHEEELLLSLGFGSGGEFSALKSHANDHARIITLMDNLAKSDSFSLSDIVNVVDSIYQHAERFDTLYAADADEGFNIPSPKLGS